MKTKQHNISTLIHAHVLDALDSLDANSVQVVVTSPPYWGMRLYKRGIKAVWPDKLTVPYGAEPTPEQYISRTTEVLRRLMRIVRDDGVIWLNLGDMYFTRAIIRSSASERMDSFEGRRRDSWANAQYKRYSSGHAYLKDKDLTLVPYTVAQEAQRLGYWLRSMIIWEKENVLPEQRIDRPVVSHEYVLMLTKSRTYKWSFGRAKETGNGSNVNHTRQLRSVWTMPTSNGKNGHPAAFPERLVERCILVSSKKKDVVLDPFLGGGTTALVAARLGRSFIGIDAVKSYLDKSAKLLKKQNKDLAITRRHIKHNKD